MDDDAFEALIVTLAIACEGRPDRAREVKNRFVRALPSNLDVRSAPSGDDIAFVLNGRRLRGWITRWRPEKEFDIDDFYSDGTRRNEPYVKLSLEVTCREE